MVGGGGRGRVVSVGVVVIAAAQALLTKRFCFCSLPPRGERDHSTQWAGGGGGEICIERVQPRKVAGGVIVWRGLR